MNNNYLTYFILLPCFCMFLQAGTVHAKAGPGSTPGLTIANAENITVSGTIVSEKGEPLFGVRVNIRGVDNSVFSDKNGKYAVEVLEGDTLEFSLKGYEPLEYAVKGEKLDVIMQSVPFGTNTISVLYGKQTKNTSVQSTSSVNGAELLKVPVAGINNALAGRLAGVNTYQASGQPGADFTTLSVRGNFPLVLINGIPRDYASVDPEQIASVTVLKDGLSTVMLGQQASKGVVLIETKEGESGKQSISATSQFGVQTPIKLPKPLSADQYALLYNEALVNDGGAARYSYSDILLYQNQRSPFTHPDVNWYDEILKKNTSFSRHNVNIFGGGSGARYFVDADFLDQKGLLKEDPGNTYSTNVDYKRYAVRTNIDIDVTPTTVLNLNLFGRIQTGNQPGGATANGGALGLSLEELGSGTVFQRLALVPSNAYPLFNPDGSLGGNSDYQYNLWGASTQSGYFFKNDRDVSADISVKKKLDNITKGLWVRGLASFNTSVSENIIRTKRYQVFRISSLTDADTTYQVFGDTPAPQVNLSVNTYQGKSLYADFATGLTKESGKHNFDALLKLNVLSNRLRASIAENYTNLAGNLKYNYDEKYLAEVALSYSGLNRYQKGERYGFFYGLGLGWNMKSEAVFKDIDWLSIIKPRVNYALTGNANPGYFSYEQQFVNSTGYTFGTTPNYSNGIREGTLANPIITWEKAHQFNAGLDVSVFENSLSLAVDYFNNQYFDLAQVRGKNSAILGVNFPDENIGIVNNRGLEFDLSYTGNTNGDFNYYLAANVSALNRTIKYIDEVERPYEWMKRTGQRAGQIFGYVAEGFFESEDEIVSSPKIQGYNPVPGDIKYKDLNNDGEVNEYDNTGLLNNKATWSYGLTIGFNYKGFDFSTLIQGVRNRKIYLGGYTEWAFQNNGIGNAYEHNLGRWTPETAATADHPRVTVGPNPNNQAPSSFWLRNGNFFRLKNVELGYTIPKSVSRKLKTSAIRLFINGLNLYTVSGFQRVDPEVYGGDYPLQSVVNGGLNVKF